MTNSLPEAQKLFSRYARDSRVRVVAVATAFEKEKYPWMADEDRIKSRLRSEGWKFPVMRDKDEQSVRKVGFGGRYGTPTTLVIDANGIVRWHGFNTSKRSARQVGSVVERLLESFYVTPIDDFATGLAKCATAYTRQKYGKARSEAEKVLTREDLADAVKTQAQRVIASIDEGVARLVARSQLRRQEGYPTDARRQLETALSVFKGVPAVETAKKKLSSLKKDKAFRREIAAERELARVQEALEKGTTPRPQLATKLEELATKYEGTAVARRIRALAGQTK